jgi:DnaJ-class molecular chaperone
MTKEICKYCKGLGAYDLCQKCNGYGYINTYEQTPRKPAYNKPSGSYTKDKNFNQ